MKKNLLIIDDDPDFVYLLQRCLRECPDIGLVSHVENGKEALDFMYCSANPGGDVVKPDIALLDINMPVMNGFEFLTEYERMLYTHPDFTSVKFYVLSSSDSPQDRASMAGHSTVQKYLLKPIECDALLSEIEIA